MLFYEENLTDYIHVWIFTLPSKLHLVSKVTHSNNDCLHSLLLSKMSYSLSIRFFLGEALVIFLVRPLYDSVENKS